MLDGETQRLTWAVETGMDRFRQLRGTWDAIFAEMPRRRYFHTYEWYDAYMHCLETDPEKVHFVVGHQGKKPVALFPLKECIHRIMGVPLRCLSVPTHPHSGLGDCLVAVGRVSCDEVMNGCRSFLHRQRGIPCDAIVFPRVLQDASVVRHLEERGPRATWVEEIDRCDYLGCDDYDTMFSGFSKNFRHSLRQARKKLGKIGNAEAVSARNGEALRECYSSFLEVEASGWKGEQGTATAIALSSELSAFYERVLAAFSAKHQCEINLLRADDRCIAAQFCLIVDDVCYVLKIGFDETYRQAAPGNMLLESQLLKCQEDDAVSCLNLISSAGWHKSWNPGSLRVYRVYLFTESYRGAYGLVASKARSRTAHLVRRVLARGSESRQLS